LNITKRNQQLFLILKVHTKC